MTLRDVIDSPHVSSSTVSLTSKSDHLLWVATAVVRKAFAALFSSVMSRPMFRLNLLVATLPESH